MSHWAKLENNIVTQVLVGPNYGDEGEAFFNALGGTWVKTSYNGNIRKNYVEFMSTSFIRGITLDNCIVIVDEVQNMLFGELDSVITRIGKNSKLILCGDFRQSDLQKDIDRKGLLDILKILKAMDYFKYVEFSERDIVRSDFVKQYIIQKSRLGFT